MRGEYEIGRFFSEGWEAFKKNMGTMVVAFILYVGATMGASMVPFFGGLINFAIAGPLWGGVLMLALRCVDGEEVTWNALFDGFQKFLPLFLAYLLIFVFAMIPMIVIMIPGVMFLGLGGVLTAGMSPDGELAAGAGVALGGGILLLVLLVVITALIVQSWYLYTFLFIMEEDDDFWVAMEKSRKLWFAQPVPATLFVLAVGVVAGLGFLLLGVGALITVPLGFCVTAVAYRNVANPAGVAAPRLGGTPHTPPPPPITPDPFANVPAQSGETVVFPPPVAPSSSPVYHHCFVFVEKTDVNAATAGQIVKLGAPKAAGSLPADGITPVRIDDWPTDDHVLSETIRENIKARKGEYLEGHRFHVSVWKGRDKKSGKNMAVATVSTT